MEKDGVTPKEWLPECILPNFRPGTFWLSARMFYMGIMLNAVGLSGPGARALFVDGRWQERTEPFFLSFMSVAKTPEERLSELREFITMLALYLHGFSARIGLQINYSCPNVGLDPSCLVKEVETGLEIAGRLGIPLMPKFNILVPVAVAREISKNPFCDAICVSNTVPWGKIPDKINWERLFGSEVSPLAKFGGGGLSGRPLLPLVKTWVRRARHCGIVKPISVGGGILSPRDLDYLRTIDASSVFLGSVATLRPWRVGRIIKEANELF